MAYVHISRSIRASPATVFDAVADVRKSPEIVPDVISVEILSGTPPEVGTRFRETRRMGKRQDSADLEITECVPGEHVRMVCDSHGTVWDTVMRVEPEGDGTRFELIMEARPHALLPRLITPLIRGMVRKNVGLHVDGVQAWCEAVRG